MNIATMIICNPLLLVFMSILFASSDAFMPCPAFRSTVLREAATTSLTMLESPDEATPTSFREAEVLGLRLMQERKYKEALKAFQTGMNLPGSKSDVIRTKSLSGPSPVGGSTGGYESKSTMSLDEFEIQAANYNMACAHAQLDQIPEAVAALQIAFENGFDNFGTVKADPDLDPVKDCSKFITLMQNYEPKSNSFNPFGLFGGN